MESVSGGQWRFGGALGERVDANVEHWILRAPGANPGLLEMFHRRDRHLPYKTPVPWAGEFAGKYLISAVQALSMSGDERLEPHVAAFVDALVGAQAEDGYLGPWPKDERLLGHWDLWGHYHCMLGLLMWYDRTGDEKAFDCVLKAADCICAIYVDGDRRPIDAGTPQINLSVLHVMGQLQRRTGSERYLALMRRIEEDMQKDGDWQRLGEQGVPYYKLPGGGTRWESLHIVQGIVELYRITGEERYKRAAVNLWESIREYDRHPSGAFSTHEKALGSIYEPGAIETCCSVAWEALTIDILRLTGEAKAADELELTTWNQVLGAQHPSGSWWTYDTPMDGVRIPSYHHINFQYRPGTPELNCCSVNAPRGLGMLSEWAMTQDDAGVFLNFYGPSSFTIKTPKTGRLTVAQETGYPVEGSVRIRVTPEKEAKFVLRLRIPEWTEVKELTLDGAWDGPLPKPGTYLAIDRTWKKGDTIELTFDLKPRFWLGEGHRHGHAAVYAGPLLLSYDAFYNPIETADLPEIDPAALELTRTSPPASDAPGRTPPLGTWKATAADGTEVALCDFASAGAHGTDYLTWLPAANLPPDPAVLQVPEEGTTGRPGAILFRWQGFADPAGRFELLVARDEKFEDIATHLTDLRETHVVVSEGLDAEGQYYWKVLSKSESGVVENRGGARGFVVDAKAQRPFYTLGERELMVASALDGDGVPGIGVRSHQQGLKPTANRRGEAGKAVAFDGKQSELRYTLPYFPDTDYTFLAWVSPAGTPEKEIQQVFSAWCAGMDDPLRVTFQQGEISARIEAGDFFATKGVPLKEDEWTHVAAVKRGPKLFLYVNGKPVQSVGVPLRVVSNSREIGIGFNPLFHGGEHFHGKIDDFAFHAQSFSDQEIADIYESER